MIRMARRWFAATTLLVTALVSGLPVTAVAADGDLAGSRDPYELERVPRSWIVAYRQEPEVRSREFVLSRVDRVRRDMRIEDELQVEAQAESVTYQVPEGITVDDVLAHYADVLGDDVLFHCKGRDCGRSNDWATQVFEEATLYGPDSNQRYVARTWEGKLISLYAIERGNKRVYAHLQILEPRDRIGIEPNALLGRRLSERGWATIEAVTPTADGGIPDAAHEVLAALAAVLERFAGKTMYLVCHLYGGDAGDALLSASQHCAETGVELIVAGTDAESGGLALALKPFGAGALLPRSLSPAARLEIVLPASQGE
jgi:hypothetical protein